MGTFLPKMSITASILSDVEKALKNEWLATNGLGGYASSTILGINTRKYHGLLVAAFNPPVDRHVLLTKMDEEVKVGGKTYSLGSNEFQWGIQPEGYRYIIEFSLTPFPTFKYKMGEEMLLKKTVFMPHEKNVTIVMYETSDRLGETAVVSVSPLVNSRHFHSVTERDRTPSFSQRQFDIGVTLQPSTGLSVLTLMSTSGRYKAGPEGRVETFFRVDRGRHGESYLDNSYKIGSFEFEVSPNEADKFSIIAAGGKNEIQTQALSHSIDTDIKSIDKLYRIESERQAAILSEFQKRHAISEMEEWLKWLVLATDSFIVYRASTQTKSVIAGYHWFEDWGRDSLISLPGLTLVTGRFDDARQVLLTFMRYCSRGIIPNKFADIARDQPVFNTVDASLWYFDSVLQYLKYTGDFRFVQDELWSTLESIIENHMKGTLFNIRVDGDGLVSHGPQLTWMDAAPWGKPITPREGKAVEIQALWYNALKTMQLLAAHFGEIQRAQEYSAFSEKARKSFVQKFWNPDEDCLFDVVCDRIKDSSIRPNQIIAVSMDFTMLDNAKANKIVELVQKRLWGVYGLKTLSDKDPRYRGRYQGDWQERDNAYHNGTVWPWLLGPFVRAFLKLKNHEAEWRSYAFKNFLEPLFNDELFRTGLGTVSEIFDGDPPHEPNGCINQAWSVAEPLRAHTEDVLLKRPLFETKVMGSNQ